MNWLLGAKTMMQKISGRILNLFGLILCCGLLTFALYLQVIANVQPCPLCIVERFILSLIGIVLLIAAIHNPTTRGLKIYGFLTLSIALIGMLAAGRHLWLQNQPIAIGQQCMPGLNYLFANLPISQALKIFVLGSADCARVTWSFLGLSMPAWTFLFFDVYALLGLSQITGLFYPKPFNREANP
jgi:disulfide bond formation protein DsbB